MEEIRQLKADKTKEKGSQHDPKHAADREETLAGGVPQNAEHCFITMAEAIAVSTGERKKKTEGREYDTPPPIPCTPKELDVLLDKWISDGIFKPNQVSKEPTEEERRDPRFYRLHNYVQHPTAECWALRRLVHCRIKEGTLELTQQEIQRNPFPSHKGKGVAAVVTCANPGEDEEENPALPATAITTLQQSTKFKNLFDQLGLTAKERKVATEALESTEITFSNKDIEVGYPDHRRPLYLAASINQIPIKRALIDTGASVNLIPLSTLQAAGISERKIQGCPMEVTGFGGRGEYTAGHIQLWLKVGPIASLARFHVVRTEVSYHVLLGRPWLHKHRLVPSTYHQCVKERLNGMMIHIAGNPSPFEQAEACLVETMFYDQWTPSGESSVSKP
ncbi:uncharacterized protein LOC115949881 [Quercus lobata]|uniref:uncharacterized protein LOC115949881 n=1 Tax=Quercus lobata TaxID=97700 RepID=UPI0012449FB1|nr:uncharacterized protein LOC115949881 [Quercus lobata]